MRNAAILVVNFRGVATETIKNIVLAGIGKLIVWDREDVAAEDLGAGFFFRDEDVGKKVRWYFLSLSLLRQAWCGLSCCLPCLSSASPPSRAAPVPALRPDLRSLLTAISYYSAWMRRKRASRV
jgi:molybdopterin/thiamine biosynthesis adenylyltransferase